jgi:hypothetical protein
MLVDRETIGGSDRALNYWAIEFPSSLARFATPTTG